MGLPIRFTRLELAGAPGDLGTLLPLVPIPVALGLSGDGFHRLPLPMALYDIPFQIFAPKMNPHS